MVYRCNRSNVNTITLINYSCDKIPTIIMHSEWASVSGHSQAKAKCFVNVRSIFCVNRVYCYFVN